jgi:hypothetical protein
MALDALMLDATPSDALLDIMLSLRALMLQENY